MSALPGRILIRGLRCRGRQGPTAADQQQAHDYLVDVELSVDIADAVSKDELAAETRGLADRTGEAIQRELTGLDRMALSLAGNPEFRQLDGAAVEPLLQRQTQQRPWLTQFAISSPREGTRCVVGTMSSMTSRSLRSTAQRAS